MFSEVLTTIEDLSQNRDDEESNGGGTGHSRPDESTDVDAPTIALSLLREIDKEDKGEISPRSDVRETAVPVTFDEDNQYRRWCTAYNPQHVQCPDEMILCLYRISEGTSGEETRQLWRVRRLFEEQNTSP